MEYSAIGSINMKVYFAINAPLLTYKSGTTRYYNI